MGLARKAIATGVMLGFRVAVTLAGMVGLQGPALPAAHADGSAADISKVKARAIASLLGGTGDGPHRRAATRANDSWCLEYMARAPQPIAWSDSVGERLASYAAGLRKLAIAYRSDMGRLTHSPEVKQRLERELAGLLEHFNASTPRPGNWYYWLIPIPDHLGAVALLLGEDIPSALSARIHDALAHQLKEMVLNGANAAWEARNHVYLGLLQADFARIQRAANHMFDNVRYGRENGVCEDYGYLFHGRLPYAGGYGAGFAYTAPRWGQALSFSVDRGQPGCAAGHTLIWGIAMLAKRP